MAFKPWGFVNQNFVGGIRHLFWLLQIRAAHFLQGSFARRDFSLTFQVSGYKTKSYLTSSTTLALPQVGIVVQGPLITRGDITFRICESLLCRYPSVPVILSTWSIKNEPYLEKFRELGVTVQVCDPPLYPGIGNINMQITTTKEGLGVANQLGCKFVLKMRTDTWFSEPDFLNYLCEEFILQSSELECAPIVVTSFNTSRVREFSINDQIQFGTISDLLVFWDAPLDHRTLEELPYSLNSLNPTQHSKNRLAEVWLITHYLESKGIDYEFTQPSYVEVITKYFVVIDESVLGMVWYKSVMRDMRSLRDQRASSGNPNFLRSEWMQAKRLRFKNFDE